MKKIKISLLILAIMAGVGGAFVGKQSDPMCHYYIQYYYTGSGYAPAGEIGYDYDCDEYSAPSEACTYWEYDPYGHPGQYAPCKMGYHFRIPHD